MSDEASVKERWNDDPARVIGFLAGLALMSVSLSSGFIWVCGEQCVRDPVVWTADRRGLLAFLAALTAWWGYLVAHRVVTGRFVDAGNHDAATEDATRVEAETGNPVEQAVDAVRGLVPPERSRQVAFLLGIGMLVSGIVVGFVFIREGNHLLTNAGGVLFLGGYVVAHYAETGAPL